MVNVYFYLLCLLKEIAWGQGFLLFFTTFARCSIIADNDNNIDETGKGMF